MFAGLGFLVLWRLYHPKPRTWLTYAWILLLVSVMLLPSLAKHSPSIFTNAAGPEILSRETIGMHETVTLKSTDGAAVSDWLEQNGFHLPDGQQSVIQDYAFREWVFLRVKLTDATPGKIRNAPPLIFVFESNHPIYPMQLTGRGDLSNATWIFLYLVRVVPLLSTFVSYVVTARIIHQTLALSTQGRDLPFVIPS